MKTLRGPVPKEVWDLLEVTQDQAGSLSQITHILKKSNVLPELIDFLRGSSDLMAKAYLRRFDSLSTQHQKITPVEAICAAEGLDTVKFLGVITEATFTQTRMTSELMAATAQPDVIQATVESALTRDGDKDRKMLHLHSGFVPVPKTQIVSMPGARIDARTQTQQTIVLPTAEADVKRMSDRFNQKLLENPPEVVIEAEFEDSEDDE